MDIRKAVTERPAIAISASLLIIVLAGIAISAQFRGGENPNIGKAFYSDDDGKTWFLDSDQLISPFDHNGKQAYAAAVYRCGTAKPFVAFLRKYSDEQRVLVEQSRQSALKHDHTDRTPTVSESSMYVKKPGNEKWIPGNTAAELSAYQEITTIVCPDGSGTPTIVRLSDADAR